MRATQVLLDYTVIKPVHVELKTQFSSQNNPFPIE